MGCRSLRNITSELFSSSRREHTETGRIPIWLPPGPPLLCMFSRRHMVKILDSPVSLGGKTAGWLMVEPLRILNTALQSALWICKREGRGGEVMHVAFPKLIWPVGHLFWLKVRKDQHYTKQIHVWEMPQFKTWILMQDSNLMEVLFCPTIKFGDWPNWCKGFFQIVILYLLMIKKSLRGFSEGRISDEGKMCKDVWSFSNRTEVSPPPFCLQKGCFLLIILCIPSFQAVIRWTLGGVALREQSYWWYYSVLLAWLQLYSHPL